MPLSDISFKPRIPFFSCSFISPSWVKFVCHCQAKSRRSIKLRQDKKINQVKSNQDQVKSLPECQSSRVESSQVVKHQVKSNQWIKSCQVKSNEWVESTTQIKIDDQVMSSQVNDSSEWLKSNQDQWSNDQLGNGSRGIHNCPLPVAGF